MKKLKYIASILTVMIALLMSVDESISLYVNITTTQIPVQTGNADTSHYHTISFGDHFFQKNSISFSDSVLATALHSFMNQQPEFGYFPSSIWQPPKYTC